MPKQVSVVLKYKKAFTPDIYKIKYEYHTTSNLNKKTVVLVTSGKI